MLYVEERSNAVRACHLSVLDFIGGMVIGELPVPTTNLRENTVPPFAVGVKEVHGRMFDGCFAIMNRDLQFNMCGLEDSFRMNKDVPNLPALISKHITEALQYAAVFWFSHLKQSNVSASKSAGKVFALLNSEKGLYWIEVLTSMDAVERAIVILQDCVRIFTVRPSSRDGIQ